MARRIRLTFVAEGVSAEAQMLEGETASVCEAVWKLLPVEGLARHAIYSGSEVALHLERSLLTELCSSTTEVLVGDVAYAFLPGGKYYGLGHDLGEICWFYDRDARPSMFEGPVPVSVFARMAGNVRPFYEACRRMRVEGAKQVLIERVVTGG